MAYSLTWLPQTLIDAGLKVAEVPGWTDRGISEMGTVKGVICHHTATAKSAQNMPTLNTLINGRPDLHGPLAQLGLGRDGTFYIVAAGKAQHAGIGNWKGISTGNSSFIGIEAENAGTPNDFPWPDIQMDAYRHGVAAILAKIGADSSMCCGHKEYALPKGRKDDPDFEMDPFRSAVADIMAGRTPPLALIPAHDGLNLTLRRGDSGAAVTKLQTSLKLAPADGRFGPLTEVAVRDFQRGNQLAADGIVGPATWQKLALPQSGGATGRDGSNTGGTGP